MERVSIEITIEEAKLFKTFRQYQEIWQDVFTIKNGSATLHFDELGRFREVEYKSRKKLKFIKT